MLREATTAILSTTFALLCVSGGGGFGGGGDRMGALGANLRSIRYSVVLCLPKIILRVSFRISVVQFITRTLRVVARQVTKKIGKMKRQERTGGVSFTVPAATAATCCHSRCQQPLLALSGFW